MGVIAVFVTAISVVFPATVSIISSAVTIIAVPLVPFLVTIFSSSFLFVPKISGLSGAQASNDSSYNGRSSIIFLALPGLVS